MPKEKWKVCETMPKGLEKLSIEEVEGYVLSLPWKTFIGPLDKNTGWTTESYLQLEYKCIGVD